MKKKTVMIALTFSVVAGGVGATVFANAANSPFQTKRENAVTITPVRTTNAVNATQSKEQPKEMKQQEVQQKNTSVTAPKDVQPGKESGLVLVARKLGIETEGKSLSQIRQEIDKVLSERMGKEIVTKPADVTTEIEPKHIVEAAKALGIPTEGKSLQQLREEIEKIAVQKSNERWGSK